MRIHQKTITIPTQDWMIIKKKYRKQEALATGSCIDDDYLLNTNDSPTLLCATHWCARHIIKFLSMGEKRQVFSSTFLFVCECCCFDKAVTYGNVMTALSISRRMRIVTVDDNEQWWYHFRHFCAYFYYFKSEWSGATINTRNFSSHRFAGSR